MLQAHMGRRFSFAGSHAGLDFAPLVHRKPCAAPLKRQCIQEGPSSPTQDPSKLKHGNDWGGWVGAINKGGGELSKVADKEAFCPGGCGKALQGGGKHTQSPNTGLLS